MTWIVGAIGVVIALINIYYGISKDNAQKGEAEIKECADTLKKALQDVLNDKQHFKAHITYIESLVYLRLVGENKISNLVMSFARDISDFCEGSKNEEDLFSSYKMAIDKIYNMEFSVCKYLIYTLKTKGK